MTESIAQRLNAASLSGSTQRELTQVLNAMQKDLSASRDTFLYGAVVYDAPSLVDGAGVTTTVSVPGAVVGDFVVSVSLGVTDNSISVTGYVSAPDTVSVRIQNESAGTLDLASTTLRALVLPYLNHSAQAGMLCGSATYDTANLADAAGATGTITVKGAALGDYVIGSFGVDLQGITCTYYVSATDTVSFRVQNESGGAIDLASTTVRVRVLPEASFGAVSSISRLTGLLLGTATYDAASTVDAAGLTTTVTVTGAVLGDFAIGSYGVDIAGMTATYYVSAADTVTLRLQNESGGTLDFASTNINARVIPKALFPLTSTLNTVQ